MSDDASGADVTRLFNPHHQTHYALSEDDHFALSELFTAVETIGHIVNGGGNFTGVGVEQHEFAPVFRVLGRHGRDVLSRAISIHPER